MVLDDVHVVFDDIRVVLIFDDGHVVFGDYQILIPHIPLSRIHDYIL